MHLSTFEEWSSLGPEQVWDKMLDEYEQVKRVASYEGVPEDVTDADRAELKAEVDQFRAEREQKIDNLLMLKTPTNLKQ